MFDLVKENKTFFLGCFFLLIIGAFLLISNNQGDAVLFFSNNRTKMSDSFFRLFTQMGEEKVYILSIVILVFIKYRYALLIPVVAVLVTIVSFLAKSFFQHPRPSTYFKNLQLEDTINYVDGVNQLSGLTSFPSGHTMSGFALFAILAFIFPQKRLLGSLFLIIALLVGISRIYLVQHFLKDIYLGAILGVIIAMMIYIFQAKIPYKTNHWANNNILTKNKNNHS